MNRKFYLGFFTVLIISSVAYFSTQVSTVYGGDAGDFLAAIATEGIPHPPGYPLYTSFGVLLSKIIPFGTLAYKIGFLSSLASVLTSVFLFFFLYKLTNRVLEPLVATLITCFVYPIFLYSSVVEVFSLNNLFIVILILSSYSFYKLRKIKYLYLVSFFLGLSLSHHHIILFLVPSLFYLIKPHIRKLKIKSILKISLLFLSGLVPYVYTFISVSQSPSVNWMGNGTISNFFNLLLRTTYGTFTAGRFIDLNIYSRLLNVLVFFEFLFRDYSIFGVILIVVGIFLFYRKNQRIFTFFVLASGSFLFLLFYASFPLADNFMLATIERYVLPIYLLLTIPLCFGLVVLNNLLSKFFEKIKIRSALHANAIFLLIFIIPFLFLFKNYRKISILKYDFAAENLALDILESQVENGLLLLTSDTPLFNSQYLFYTNEKYKNIKLVHLSKLYLPYYLDQLKLDYPELKLPSKISTPADVEEILKENGQFNIFSQVNIPVENGRFVPWGLLFKYERSGHELSVDEIEIANEKLWKNYHNPLNSSLSKTSDHKFLNDIKRYYLISRLDLAEYYARLKNNDLAINHLFAAEKLDAENETLLILMTQVYIDDKKCDEAARIITRLERASHDQTATSYLKYLNSYYCLDDPATAEFWLSLFEENSKKKETSLENL